jgi:23S rRNA (uracil1939-C5)-methyltransferase
MQLSIEKLIYGGDGLARAPGSTAGGEQRSMAVLMPFVVPGERVEAEIRQEKPGFARGVVRQIIEESPGRVQAHCPYFQQCGGCHYQHIAYERQVEYKSAILRETLQRIAKIELRSEIRVHAGSPWNYRNRTRMQVRTEPEFALGYFRLGSHEFLAVRECPISSPLINRALSRLVETGGLGCPAGIEEIELFADAGDERLLLSAFCTGEGTQQELLRWAEAVQAEVAEVAGVTCFSSRRRSSSGRFDDDEAAGEPSRLVSLGAPSIQYAAAGGVYQASAGAFFQVNRHLIDELVSVVTGGASGELALDLYAGVGLFSAALAKTFHHIFGVEASQTAHGDFRQNVPEHVKAVRARTEDYLKTRGLAKGKGGRGQAGKTPDLVVLDPPRAGAGKAVIESLARLGAARIRYVSCDPATLARDLQPLVAAGYRVEEAHLFDLFPQTYHLESVMLLARP